MEYDRSPEARYPVAIEQGYATARWIVREGAAHGLDPERMAMLNPLSETCATRAAVAQAIAALRQALHSA